MLPLLQAQNIQHGPVSVSVSGPITWSDPNIVKTKCLYWSHSWSERKQDIIFMLQKRFEIFNRLLSFCAWTEVTWFLEVMDDSPVITCRGVGLSILLWAHRLNTNSLDCMEAHQFLSVNLKTRCQVNKVVLRKNNAKHILHSSAQFLTFCLDTPPQLILNKTRKMWLRRCGLQEGSQKPLIVVVYGSKLCHCPNISGPNINYKTVVQSKSKQELEFSQRW